MSVRRPVLVCVLYGALMAGQNPPRAPDSAPAEPKLPDGRSQREEILKADHQKTLKDADELIKMSEELKIELEKNDRHVLSVATLKKLDDMEKLIRRIRGRMKRF